MIVVVGMRHYTPAVVWNLLSRSFPVYMEDNGKEVQVSSQEALWLKTSATPEEHKQFFRCEPSPFLHEILNLFPVFLAYTVSAPA